MLRSIANTAAKTFYKTLFFKTQKLTLRAHLLILRKLKNHARVVWAEESKTGLGFEIET